jgi:hypothetical protein
MCCSLYEVCTASVLKYNGCRNFSYTQLICYAAYFLLAVLLLMWIFMCDTSLYLPVPVYGVHCSMIVRNILRYICDIRLDTSVRCTAVIVNHICVMRFACTSTVLYTAATVNHIPMLTIFNLRHWHSYLWYRMCSAKTVAARREFNKYMMYRYTVPVQCTVQYAVMVNYNSR